MLVSTLLGMALQVEDRTWPDHAWLNGYWLHCGEDGQEVTETWVGEFLTHLGSLIYVDPAQEYWHAQMRLGPSRAFSGEHGVSYFVRHQIEPSSELEYVLIETGQLRSVFENPMLRDPEVDVPFRITYARLGDQLTMTAEYEMRGSAPAASLIFSRTELGETCLPGTS